MSRILIVLFFVLISKFAISQTSNFFLVNLAIEEKSILNFPQNLKSKELLLNKLINNCNKVDGVIIDEFSDYYLVSDIYSIQSQKSNAGFLPVGKYNMNLKLKLIYTTGGKIFKELNFTKEYIVNTESEALEKLIYDFDFSEDEMNGLLIEGAKKMNKFYSDNCNLVIDAAKKYQSIGEPEKALAICLSIPSDVPCFNNISSLTKDLYTSLSYKVDYSIFLKAQDFVSKGQYGDAFKTLSEISIYSQFYGQAQALSKQINDFIFNQKELQKKKELAESEQKLKETEVELQQKRNELQESINQTNVEIANQKNESDRLIALQQQESQKQMKAMELQSKERTEMMKTAGNLLGAYINRPQPPKNTNFYIIK
jgi:hypothetical protein